MDFKIYDTTDCTRMLVEDHIFLPDLAYSYILSYSW